MGRAIYLDHNAANPPDPRVLEVFRRALDAGWANPSSAHRAGRRARALVEEAREQVAALLGVAAGQVTFCASGTEALNQALVSATRPGERPRAVASAVEHPAVLEPLRALDAEGRVEAVLAPVDAAGRVVVDRLAPLAAGAALVAVIAAQNETGVVQPLDAVGQVCAAAGAPLLVDASQALGRVARDWTHAPWDLLVVSGHKLRAPRGAAALVHRGGVAPGPLVRGGPQELGRRAGTEDVAAIAALGAACDLVRRGELLDPAALRELRDRLEARLLEAIPGAEVVGQGVERLPQTTAVLLPGGDSEALLAALDLAGVAASAGAACSSGSLVRSHVLEAMGVDEARARGRLRLSFGPETTWEELAAAVDALAALRRQGA
ncbi:MAG: aminotransferase class V-fold PLP-dependent enzyme [Planctomycetes bacterium]|nr:aminotransferase class V-fold PLP-dependent enzyme [Planctomycetota bacterium]